MKLFHWLIADGLKRKRLLCIWLFGAAGLGLLPAAAVTVADNKPATDSVWSVDYLSLESLPAETSQQPGLRWQWRGFRWPQAGFSSAFGVVSCPHQHRLYPRVNCRHGRLRSEWRINGQPVTLDYPVRMQWDALSGQWRLALLKKIATLKQPASFHLGSADGERVELQTHHWPLAELLRWTGTSQKSQLAGLEGALSGHWQFFPVQAEVLRGPLRLQGLSWENADGSVVLADVGLSAALRLRKSGHGGKARWQLELKEGRFVAGEALVADVYFNFTEQAVDFSTKIIMDEAGHPIKALINLSIPAVFSLELALSDFDSDGLPGSQTVHFQVDDLETLNRLYGRDWLALKGIADARLGGSLSGRFSRVANRFRSAQLTLQHFYGQAPEKKLQVEDLQGTVYWQSQGDVPPSTLSWQSALLAGLPIQASGVGFFFQGDTLRFPDHSYLPVFDGALVVEHLLLKHLFGANIDIDFSGRIEPISLALITRKMGWPVMQGTIAGRIPGMHKKGEQIVFDGVIDVAVFDGSMKISHLAMERLFGVAPVIAADIAFDALNLQQITTTFDFGEITGLVAGKVAGLRITNWKTDRMDAEIHSVRRKGVKQTLSQKALDRISSLGGVQGAISRSFLRFFKRFKYRRLGMRCRLRREVCEMGGIRRFKGGYLLVEGGGLPRVNIIGYQRYIDWEEFLDRLLNRDYTEAQVQ
jgi:hypothetical protein